MSEQRVQRRLAAILAADVVGYSRLIREDEEGTLSRLRHCLDAIISPKIAHYDGRIVKTMGDGILVEFPSAVDAVKSAVEFQTTMAERNAGIGDSEKIEFRVGVNLGDVVIDGDDIHGDGVNVAARLEGIADPGGICISGKVYEEVRDRFDVALEDLGEREVKNINRPVRVWRWSKTGSRVAARAAPTLELPDKPSIAVLPFDNLSGDTEQDFIGDGLTEDIITGLSRIRSFFVIARNSTFQYKGTSPDVRSVAEELGVRYVIEGSVRRIGDRVRVTVQLIDGSSGNHIWAERFDRELDDIFAVQDEITGSVVGQLEPELGRAEYERVKSAPPENLNAWELYHRGMVQYLKWGQAEAIEARRLFEQAIEHDPNLADAHAGLAMTIFSFWILQPEMTEIEKSELDYAADAASRAVALDGKSALAHIALGRARRHQQNAEAALSECETAIRINPSSASGHGYLGVSLFQSGRAQEGIPHIKLAMRLSPADPETGAFQCRLAGAYLFAGDCESAIQWANKSLRTWDSWLPRAYLVAALAHLDRHEEAVDAREELETFRPGINIEFVRDRYPSTHPPYLSCVVEGLRKAGLPEKSPEQDDALPLPDKPSIAVLPFDNMSADPEQEYFSDGISEDIITALSRARWFRVVSRNSTFTYKGTSLNVRQIARELDVHYVLEGSVRKAGNRVRITAQLLDGSTDNHLWAERYDRELEDIFDVQDEITHAIAVQIEPEIRRAELNRAVVVRPENLSVWDVYQQGMWHMYRKEDPDIQKALEHFRRATELDPNFSRAYSGVSHACSYLAHWALIDDREDYIDQAMRAAKRAVELDGDDPNARWALGRCHRQIGDNEGAMAELEEALRLNPLTAEPCSTIGRILLDQGRYSEAMEAMQKAIRLCPKDQSIGIVMARLAEAYLHLHEYDKAIEWSRNATRQTVAPRIWGRAVHLAALGHAGEHAKDPDQALKNLLERRPDFSINFIREHYFHDPMRIPDVMEHFIDGLRKAGVPE